VERLELTDGIKIVLEMQSSHKAYQNLLIWSRPMLKAGQCNPIFLKEGYSPIQAMPMHAQLLGVSGAEYSLCMLPSVPELD